MTVITDPNNNPPAKTSLDGRLNVSSRSDSRTYYNSRDLGKTFVWTSSFSAATGNHIIYIKNTSTIDKLYIKHISIGGVSSGLFELFEAESGTVVGTPIEGVNMNRIKHGKNATSTSCGDAVVTGIVNGERLAMKRVPANSTLDIHVDALVLGQNDAIIIRYTGSTGIVDASILGFYDVE